MGAALFAAADFALAVASNSYGEAAVATNVTISYIKASTEGSILEAVATEESRTRRTGLTVLKSEMNWDKSWPLRMVLFTCWDKAFYRNRCWMEMVT